MSAQKLLDDDGREAFERLGCTGRTDGAPVFTDLHDQFERGIAGALNPIRGLASKAAEHLGRIAAIFTVVDDPGARSVTEDAMQRAAVHMEFYLGEALRLSGVQP